MVRISRLAMGPLLLLAAPRGALAQDTDAQQRAAAEALFEDATRLMDAGRAIDACPKLTEVVRLQPAGIGAKLKLAECYEASGQLASAFAAYGFAARAAAAANDVRASDATARAAALKPRLSTLTIVPPGNAPPDLQITRNRAVIGRGQWATAVPVDGGSQVVEATAGGHLPRVTTAMVPREGGAVTLTMPPLDPAPPSPSSEARAATEPPPTRPVGDEGRDDGVPAWVWISGGAGLVLGAVAIGFAVDQSAAAATIEDRCGPGRDRCPDDYDADGDRAREQLDFGLFVGLGAAGAVALGASIVGLVAHAAGGESRSGSARLTAWASPQVGGVGLLQPLP